MVTVGEVKQTIVQSLGLGGAPTTVLQEAYVTTPKEYDLTTERLSKQTIETHLKLYKGYIEKLNRISSELDTSDRSSADNRASGIRSLKQAEVFCRNAVHLHELYFANISDVDSEIAFDSIAYMRLARDFGSFDDWQWDFIACADAARQGWAVTAYDTFLRRYTNFIIDGDDVGIPVGCYPIIVMDMVEHSYFRDYRDDKDQYLKNMMQELNWEVIGRRVDRAEAVARVLK